LIIPVALFFTFGCRLNQLETESIAAAFHTAGFSIKNGGVDSCADIVIVNTCTVTSKAEQKARRFIRSLLKNTGSPVVVTGCYAKLNVSEINALDTGPEKRLYVVQDKSRLLELPCFLLNNHCRLENFFSLNTKKENSFCFFPERFEFHSRAFIKIEDGCDNACSYCRVRLARGKSRSLGAADALERLRDLEAAGVAEVTLTGVNISQYRHEGMDLGAFISFLLKGTNRIALRLSSLEPDIFSAVFFSAVQDSRVRPYFHLSVQSSSAGILKKMGRNYTRETLFRTITSLRKIRDDPFISCDIIAGFPGERAQYFEETYSFCSDVDFAWIHAFPFSPRPGTPAYNLDEKISERETGVRVARLFELAAAGKKRYISRWLGKNVFAVTEGGGNSSCRETESEFLTATSENYLKLIIPVKNAPAFKGNEVRCKIVSLNDRIEVRADAFAEICTDID
jgi:threonylcarbamoyladenosine tRNA methylthiotransferase MtaB